MPLNSSNICYLVALVIKKKVFDPEVLPSVNTNQEEVKKL
jgi:hypothetical protein